MTQPEKRIDQRIHTVLPVFLENATGVTCDVSASGVFFWTDDSTYIAGDQISFAMEISKPAGRETIKCRGDIVRTEQRGTALGVAVRIIKTAMEPIKK
ncbi:MAG: PilZ domain-containing protein [Gammaproteobacteria bacterium]|nr:PilZ domain-containing protein [Gammaproteobacteria bacterium]